MVIAFLKTDSERATDAKVVKLVDRIWFPNWNPYYGRFNHRFHPHITLLRTLAIANFSAGPGQNLSQLSMILPLPSQAVEYYSDHSDKCLDPQDPFMQAAAYGTKIIDHGQRLIEWDGLGGVRVLSGISFAHEPIGENTLLTIQFNSEVKPKEFCALRFLLRIRAKYLIESRRNGVAAAFKYLELPSPVPDSLNSMIRDHEIPCCAWHGDLAPEQEYAKGGCDIVVYCPETLSAECNPSPDKTGSGWYNPEGSFSSDRYDYVHWRFRRLFATEISRTGPDIRARARDWTIRTYLQKPTSRIETWIIAIIVGLYLLILRMLLGQ